MKSVFIICAFLATLASARRLAKDITFGDCYNIKTDPKLDLAALAQGKWFETARYYNDFEGTADCTEQTFVHNATTKEFSLSYYLRFENGTTGRINSSGNYTLTEDETQLSAIYPSGEESVQFSFDVIATDYTNYAVTYSCYQVSDDVLPVKDERLWVLSRKPTLSAEAAAAVEEALIIDGTSLDWLLYETNQNDCV